MGLLLAGCDGPTYTYRYRLTLEVEADGQVHSGTSVVEVREWRTSKWSLQPNLLKTKIVGEGTVIDLGRGRLLIALLEGIPAGTPRSERRGREWIGPSPTGMLSKLFGIGYEWNGARNKGLEQLSRRRGTRGLAADQLPILITFTDIKNPKSLVVVDPNDLSRTLGTGARFKLATIEITDAPITKGIEDKLPWLKAIGGKYIDGASTARNSIGFHGGQFRRSKL